MMDDDQTPTRPAAADPGAVAPDPVPADGIDRSGAGVSWKVPPRAAADDPGRPIGRRTLLGLLGLGAVGVLLGSKAQDVLESVLRPVQIRDSTGLSSYLPGSGRFRFYSVVGFSPSRTTDEYRLKVDGQVDRPLDLSFADLTRELPQTSMTKDFQCVTGWRVDDVPWKGVLLRELLDRAGVRPEATHLRFFSFDGTYTETLTLEQARRDDVLVAHSMLGKTVTKDHGGPVRLYVAPMYGYKSLKWLERIEVVVGEQPVGYWEKLGYDVEAWIGRSNGRDDAPVE
jgi:DMSO/TMAO reductase YedYZ molybdopterin-dependent catalytic subunit